ncbi:MAG TPA: slipin family protein, partial [bacterium]|nr:slipin family protein [bacterium]
DTMKRTIAKQAETKRKRRAKIISAKNEFQAAQKILDAAKIIEQSPVTLQLRFLQTVKEIAAENNSVTFFPIPIELFKWMSKDK